MQVWIVAISHKHGEDHAVFDNYEDAELHLYNYVVEWWYETGPGNWEGADIPEEPSDAIEMYFMDHDYEFSQIVSYEMVTDVERLAEKSSRS